MGGVPTARLSVNLYIFYKAFVPRAHLLMNDCKIKDI